MKKSAILASLILATAPTAYADTIYGLYADANYWHTASDSTEQTDASTRTTFDNKSKGQAMASVSLEHGVPLVPNVRVRYADLKATQKADKSSKQDGQTADFIAYYEILDNVVSVDVGLGAKRLEGNSTINGKQWLDWGKTMPMAYASVGGKLPFTGLSAKAELGLAKASKASATDANAELKYNFVDKAMVDVGIKAGYRVLSYKNDKVNYGNFVPAEKHPFETSFKGPYVGVEIHF